jgi:hypothetical protein
VARKAIAAALRLRVWEQVVTILLRLQQARLSTALAVFLSQHGCPARVCADETIEVELPHELHGEQARLEVDLYVRLWQALHGVGVDVLD